MVTQTIADVLPYLHHLPPKKVGGPLQTAQRPAARSRDGAAPLTVPWLLLSRRSAVAPSCPRFGPSTRSKWRRTAAPW